MNSIPASEPAPKTSSRLASLDEKLAFELVTGIRALIAAQNLAWRLVQEGALTQESFDALNGVNPQPAAMAIALPRAQQAAESGEADNVWIHGLPAFSGTAADIDRFLGAFELSADGLLYQPIAPIPQPQPAA